MPKVLAQTGISLADVYDVEGSIAGTDELLSKEVSLVHEMGGQIFSERLESFLIDLNSTAIAQGAGFDIEAAAFPDSVNRVLGAVMIADTAARTSHCQISMHTPEAGLNADLPIVIWDSAIDAERTIRVRLPGGVVSNLVALIPAAGLGLPNLMTRTGAPNTMGSLFFRGASSAFGAGTVTIRALVMLCRANPGNPVPGHPSSHGLPLPGW